MKNTITGLLLVTIVSCGVGKTDDDIKITPEIIKEALRIERQESIDSVKFIKLGGCQELKVVKYEKCNVTTGYFATNKPVKDSLDLAFLANRIADSLFRITMPEAGCLRTVTMAQAFIYNSKIDYQEDEGNYMSMCTVNPLQGSNKIYVNSFYIKKGRK